MISQSLYSDREQFAECQSLWWGESSSWGQLKISTANVQKRCLINHLFLPEKVETLMSRLSHNKPHEICRITSHPHAWCTFPLSENSYARRELYTRFSAFPPLAVLRCPWQIQRGVGSDIFQVHFSVFPYIRNRLLILLDNHGISAQRISSESAISSCEVRKALDTDKLMKNRYTVFFCSFATE